jgi:hypothetical protein
LNQDTNIRSCGGVNAGSNPVLTAKSKNMKKYIMNQLETKPFGGMVGIVIILIASLLIAIL